MLDFNGGSGKTKKKTIPVKNKPFPKSHKPKPKESGKVYIKGSGAVVKMPHKVDKAIRSPYAKMYTGAYKPHDYSDIKRFMPKNPSQARAMRNDPDYRIQYNEMINAYKYIRDRDTLPGGGVTKAKNKKRVAKRGTGTRRYRA